MGYTHYWAFDPTQPEVTENWPAFVDDARKIIETAQAKGTDIVWEWDETNREPELTDTTIRFNGAGEDGHETFYLSTEIPEGADYDAQDYRERGFVWGFCKTARKPYDLAVTAILLRGLYHFPNSLTIGSDGDWESEWQHGAGAWEAAGKPVFPERGPHGLVKRLFGQVVEVDPLQNTSKGPRSVRQPA